MLRLRKERSIETALPRARPKLCYTGRSTVRGRDARAALGGGGAPVRPPLREFVSHISLLDRARWDERLETQGEQDVCQEMHVVNRNCAS